MCDKNRYELRAWKDEELAGFIDKCRIVESLSWHEACRHKGLGIESIRRSEFPLPLQQVMNTLLSPDVQCVYEFRATIESRVFGVKSERIFSVLWFDRGHDIFPKA
jgi:hypothetical protein